MRKTKTVDPSPDRRGLEPHEPTKADLVRAVSHQIKSPLGSLITLLKTVADGFTGDINPQAHQFIERAIGHANDAKQIINDIFMYEAFADRRVAQKDEINITRLLVSLIDRLQAAASEKKISFNHALEKSPTVIIHGHSGGLENALRNIIENAIKYSPENREVAVALAIVPRHTQVVITIADTGYGIAASELASIFEPFYRSTQHRASLHGTGLGLPIAQRIIAAHGGTIQVRSKPDLGSTFEIVLPYIRQRTTRTPVARRKKIVIIGGVTGGPKAAARLRRLDEECDIIIIEKSEFLSYSGCGLPSFICGKVRSPKALMSTADNTIRDVNFFKAIKNITIYNSTEATAIDRVRRTVIARAVGGDKTLEFPYDKLILATGSTSYIPPIPGINHPRIYSLYKIEDAQAIKAEFLKRNALDVCIVGGGLIGVEMAESLSDVGARVTILEKESRILLNLFDADIAEKLANVLNKKGVKAVTSVSIDRIREKNGILQLETRAVNFSADFVILSAGVRPNAELGKRAGLAVGDFGGLTINKYLQTSDKSIYAIGDCTETDNPLTNDHMYLPLGSTSTKMGRIAADNICGLKKTFKGAINSAMFKMFDVNVARTGLTSAQARAQGYKPVSVVVAGLDRAHYFPGVQNVFLKVIADAESRKLLGAQGFGRGDVVSSLQLLAAAIMTATTVDEAFDLDIGYAPPFNNPIHSAQTACLVLANKMDNLFRTISAAQLQHKLSEYQCIDVSPHYEHTVRSIPGSLNIPLENLRAADPVADRRQPIVLYSKTSSGAYAAYRYLITKGYTNLRVLEGGYDFWQQ